MSFSRLRKDLSRQDRSFLRIYDGVANLEKQGLLNVTESKISTKSTPISFRNKILEDAFMSYGGGAVIEGMGEVINSTVHDYCTKHGYDNVILKNEHFLDTLRTTVKRAMTGDGLNVEELSKPQFDEMIDYWANVAQEHVRMILLEKTNGIIRNDPKKTAYVVTIG